MNKVVLGGGLTGLSASYYLRLKYPLQEINLLEATNRTGGWIKSTQHNGFIFEQGPRTIRPQGIKGINTLKLIQEIGLDNQIQFIPKSHPAALNRMIYVNGKLHTLPSSLWSIFTKTSPFSKPLISYLLNERKKPQHLIADNDEPIYDFVERRFGTEIADYAISPLICGICAGNAKQISVKFLMENLFNIEQKYGSITKGLIYNKSVKNKIEHNALSQKAKREKWSVYFFKEGLEMLPRYLTKFNEEKNVTIHLNTVCTAIELGKNVTVHTNTNESFITDHLISSISTKKLSTLIIGHQELTNLLANIPFVNVCVINLCYKGDLLKKNGFGFLVPPKENLPILGVIFDSCCVPIEGFTTLTVMMGGYWFETQFGQNPTHEYLLNIALNHISKILEISQEPDLYQINVLRDCIPQYNVGHNDIISKINKYIQTKKLPISLCGNSYSGVGINDCIYSAKTIIDTL